MNHIEFIEKNIKQVLVNEGFTVPLALGGGRHAVEYYKQASQASKKGAMFDDCLYRARVWAENNATKDEKPAKKARARKTVGTLSLF